MEVLRYLHDDHRIIHHDVHERNILIDISADETAVAKLWVCDLGISQPMDQHGRAPLATRTFGSSHAPEQLLCWPDDKKPPPPPPARPERISKHSEKKRKLKSQRAHRQSHHQHQQYEAKLVARNMVVTAKTDVWCAGAIFLGILNIGADDGDNQVHHMIENHSAFLVALIFITNRKDPTERPSAAQFLSLLKSRV
jgi:serine/threonine protein kinase